MKSRATSERILAKGADLGHDLGRPGPPHSRVTSLSVACSPMEPTNSRVTLGPGVAPREPTLQRDGGSGVYAPRDRRTPV
jgi:hypothetical protein